MADVNVSSAEGKLASAGAALRLVVTDAATETAGAQDSPRLGGLDPSLLPPATEGAGGIVDPDLFTRFGGRYRVDLMEPRFGAIGDGGTDDTAAATAAIAALAALGGGVLRLTPGAYALQSQLVVDGVEIVIEWAGASIAWGGLPTVSPIAVANGGRVTFVPDLDPRFAGAVWNDEDDDAAAINIAGVLARELGEPLVFPSGVAYAAATLNLAGVEVIGPGGGVSDPALGVRCEIRSDARIILANAGADGAATNAARVAWRGFGLRYGGGALLGPSVDLYDAQGYAYQVGILNAPSASPGVAAQEAVDLIDISVRNATGWGVIVSDASGEAVMRDVVARWCGAEAAIALGDEHGGGIALVGAVEAARLDNVRAIRDGWLDFEDGAASQSTYSGRGAGLRVGSSLDDINALSRPWAAPQAIMIDRVAVDDGASPGALLWACGSLSASRIDVSAQGGLQVGHPTNAPDALVGAVRAAVLSNAAPMLIANASGLRLEAIMSATPAAPSAVRYWSGFAGGGDAPVEAGLEDAVDLGIAWTPEPRPTDHPFGSGVASDVAFRPSAPAAVDPADPTANALGVFVPTAGATAGWYDENLGGGSLLVQGHAVMLTKHAALFGLANRTPGGLHRLQVWIDNPNAPSPVDLSQVSISLQDGSAVNAISRALGDGVSTDQWWFRSLDFAVPDDGMIIVRLENAASVPIRFWTPILTPGLCPRLGRRPPTNWIVGGSIVTVPFSPT